MSTLAKVVPIPRGDYSASTTYNSLDIVRYDGKAWMCKVDRITGITPAAGNYWMLVVQDGGGATNLGSLNDVTVSEPSNGQILLYNSTSGKWENSNFTQTSALNDLTDVTISSQTNGQILVYDSSSNKWKNTALPTTNYNTKGMMRPGRGLQLVTGNDGRVDLQVNVIFDTDFYISDSGSGVGSGGNAGDIVHAKTFTKKIYLTQGDSQDTYDRELSHDYNDAYYEFFLNATTTASSSPHTDVATAVYLNKVDRTVSSPYVCYEISGVILYVLTEDTTEYQYGSIYLTFSFYREIWNIQKS